MLSFNNLINSCRKQVIYYYNATHPYAGIKSFLVIDELHLTKYRGFKAKSLGIQYLVANYNLTYGTGQPSNTEEWISVYAPYEDPDILRHDDGNVFYLLSYNQDKLIEKYHQSVIDKENYYRKELMKIEELKKDEDI